MRTRTCHADVDHDGDLVRRAGLVLVKEAEALQPFAKSDTLIVDKTGTLTEGKPVIYVAAADGILGDAELLALPPPSKRARNVHSPRRS